MAAELARATDEALLVFDRMDALKRQGVTEPQVIRLEAERMDRAYDKTADEIPPASPATACGPGWQPRPLPPASKNGRSCARPGTARSP
jgi:hypothetical protein